MIMVSIILRAYYHMYNICIRAAMNMASFIWMPQQTNTELRIC